MQSLDAFQDWLKTYRQVPLLLEQERWKDALETIAQLQTLLPVQPSLAETLPWQDLNLALHQILSAQAEIFWEIHPEIQLAAWQAQAYFHLKQAHQAIQVLQKLIANHSVSAAVYHQLSRYLWAEGRVEEGLLPLYQALEKEPAYLPAYIDLVFLANGQKAFERVYQLARMGFREGFSLRLLEEVALAAAQREAFDLRFLLLELCVQNIQPESRDVLVDLAKSLYLQGDYKNCEYLSYHLMQVFSEDAEIFDLHLLAVMQLEHWVPAIRLLKRSLAAQAENPGHWFRLGIAYSRWQMPLLARYALGQALALNPETELQLECQALLEQLPQSRSLEASVAELLRESLLTPGFSEKIRNQCPETLAELGIAWNDELGEALQEILI
ncbi:hypothetical protein COW36_18025 [bacterium (Candidatus Blackallbacteria) CG17_big_fil_post_rev_8_21_14_2_50_48_46]|uniref:Uncharacterized protein n=1 Tax=bacterium (Candidatus Blackallbacteria) CG17_big_fil_post_rev_8_21_14_2_50_48_46 TaxID=2014261 RepID=A0A2M7G0R9_9BACT|nr:MAG: hypothetical protein COW64_00700 [bacterium (Candidatus Blackallbacteria) CG18_big_fil_WC_8_21_14_2_50_49_26]PIW15314.1 MAG: hypothetical protein COW36_18025 [bacterium (Candidatus Blackallbacteria) CG17_big_fil_post_rev_8_21_14_2_50_48_46]PIW45176.1 MAG: hypothetical protein COW20_20990 [bacterium (Candidatus Blackallbacteria) CG13_big_fil_rev_8_21_14_2_50_49_14]